MTNSMRNMHTIVRMYSVKVRFATPMTHKSECFVSAPISNGNPSFHTGTLAEYILVKFDVENETRFNCNRHTPESLRLFYQPPPLE